MGFLMHCDVEIKVHEHSRGNVSIPAGFSDALRLIYTAIVWFVSISISFQSLLGFLMRCDTGRQDLEAYGICAVSIPAGFSDALRRERN